MATSRSRWLFPALAALSGLLYVACFPGFGVFAVTPIVFVPLLFAIRSATPRSAATLGAMTGIVACGLGFRWILPVLVRFGDMSRPAAVAVFASFVLAQAARFALQAFFTVKLSPRFGHYVAAGLAFVAAETLTPAAMQWSFAASLAARVEMLQAADIAGPTLACLPFVLASAAIVELLRTKRLRWLAVGIAPLALSYAYGVARIRQVDRASDKGARLTIGVVQGAMPMSGDPVAEARALAEERRLQRELEARSVDLSVWSESSIPNAIHLGHAESDLVDALGELPTTPTIVAAEVLADSPPGRAFNSALLLENGHLRARYDKRTLLPFSERIPFGDVFPWLYRLSPASSRFTPGELGGPRTLAGHELAITICYEDALSSQTREATDRGRAELLINVTNDAWFAGSAEPITHLALARARAIEHRRYLVHATSTGVSAVVDPVGRIVTSAPENVAVSLVAEARWLDSLTIFDRIGEMPAWVLSLFALAFAFSRKPSDSQPHRDGGITT